MREGHENYETENMKCDQYDFEAENNRYVLEQNMKIMKPKM